MHVLLRHLGEHRGAPRLYLDTTALATAGYTVPEGLDPFTTAFDAVSGNSYDDLLEALREALGAGADYADLESDFAANGTTLPEAPEPAGPGTDDTAPATVRAASR